MSSSCLGRLEAWMPTLTTFSNIFSNSLPLCPSSVMSLILHFCSTDQTLLYCEMLFITILTMVVWQNSVDWGGFLMYLQYF